MKRGTVVTGKTLNGPNQPAKTFSPGRVCVEQGCGTRLSVYNDGVYCSIHLRPDTDMRVRGRRRDRAA